MIDKIAVWKALCEIAPDLSQLNIAEISNVLYKSVKRAEIMLKADLLLELRREAVLKLLKAEFHQYKHLGIYPAPRIRNFYGVDMEIWPQKFGEVKKYLRWFRNNGFAREKGPTKNTPRPIWRFYHTELKINFEFIANFESNTGYACHIVEIGTKTIQVPIMKMLCGEELDAHNRLEAG